MKSEELKQRAVEFLREFDHGDAAKIAPMLDNSFEYRLMISMPAVQTTFSKEQTLANFLPMLKQMVPGGFNFKIHTTVAEGSQVAIQAESDTTVANGKKYTNRYHFYFRFEGDKIAELLEYCDTNQLREVFFADI